MIDDVLTLVIDFFLKRFLVCLEAKVVMCFAPFRKSVIC